MPRISAPAPQSLLESEKLNCCPPSASRAGQRPLQSASSAQTPPPPRSAPPAASWPLPADPGSHPMASHAPQDPTHPQHSARGRKQRRGAAGGAERREAELGFGPSPSRLEDCAGSGGGRLSLRHQPNDKRRERTTPERRCWRLPKNSKAWRATRCPRALTSIPPAAVPPRPVHPSVRTQRPPHPSAELMPALTVGEGALPLGGGWGARGRHRGVRRRRRESLKSHNEAARGRAASRAVAPPPLPQDFAPEPAVSAR